MHISRQRERKRERNILTTSKEMLINGNYIGTSFKVCTPDDQNVMRTRCIQNLLP